MECASEANTAYYCKQVAKSEHNGFVMSTSHSEPKGSRIESRQKKTLINDSSCVVWSSNPFNSQLST
ncbi:hypothetical protein DPMN_003707 [Dreissena polymorpha]|uniref:Uncharacterized protein n=1 Tax=Dreissena polymorpha TaxID=45954 RepID=A0A9D4MNX5_DREPO|nr:hypothetical protein DPMN_003707 [Dreissena polymorpha]